VDIWEADDVNSRLRAAFDFLSPYVDPDKSWPHPVLKEADRMELFPILKMADRAYPDGNYLKMVEKLPSDDRSKHRINLVSAVMR
jgi:hypothetical protein